MYKNNSHDKEVEIQVIYNASDMNVYIKITN